jgi:hypothetical protein
MQSIKQIDLSVAFNLNPHIEKPFHVVVMLCETIHQSYIFTASFMHSHSTQMLFIKEE